MKKEKIKTKVRYLGKSDRIVGKHFDYITRRTNTRRIFNIQWW